MKRETVSALAILLYYVYTEAEKQIFKNQ